MHNPYFVGTSISNLNVLLWKLKDCISNGKTYWSLDVFGALLQQRKTFN